MPFDRKIFFDKVRPMFGGELGQGQVDNMNYILDCWDETYEPESDLRWLANPLAQTKWETSATMEPIEEYGKGSGQPYGERDPTTGQTYYGRGYIQLTWRDNYAKADSELGFSGPDSLEWHADNALDPDKAAAVMFLGMQEGWFRSDEKGKQTLERYFNASVDDPYGAREIINGDKNYTKDWLPPGVTVGSYIATDHETFLKALEASYVPDEVEPGPVETVVNIVVQAPPGIRVVVKVVAPKRDMA